MIDQLINKYADVGMKILEAAIIFVIGWYAVKIILHILSKMMEKSQIDAIIENFVISILNIGSKIIVVITVIAQLGVPTTSLVAVLTTAGAAIALGLQDSLKGIASGITILFSKPFVKGDIIEIDGYVGTVQEIQLLYTIVMTFDNKMVVIPNNDLVSSSFVNYSHEEVRRVTITLDLHPDNDIAQFKKALMEVIEKHPYALQEPAPCIKISEYKEQSVVLQIWVWADNEHFYEVNDDLLIAIREIYKQQNVKVPARQIDVHIQQSDLNS
ncbi:mechanosensitive ion channel family protein [Allocoprobacillus halotolerans]|uniref:Mechanosensitive ion channel family protein n=1 Tax=Allocoprobacillus halotolerans TaxID=2944914 RepID=A0ABY5I3T3_9FIRM|nr:mechanosensitive ion channel family protein [Allocoprobacillus halotolerans]UTY40001.1 mechanosensitive ion channel family protein [Allocoprobacillus halotolerans]